MIKTTIKTIQANGTWEGKFGVMYQFEVELEDSTVGEVNAKTETPPYTVGSTVWYEIKGENAYGKKLKITTSDPDQQSGGFKAPAPQGSDTQTRIENSWAVQTAIQIYGPIPQTGFDIETYLKKVADLAPRMLEMRDEVSKPKAVEPVTDKASAEDGLPF